MKVVIAFALAVALIAGCSDSGTEPTTSSAADNNENIADAIDGTMVSGGTASSPATLDLSSIHGINSDPFYNYFSYRAQSGEKLIIQSILDNRPTSQEINRCSTYSGVNAQVHHIVLYDLNLNPLSGVCGQSLTYTFEQDGTYLIGFRYVDPGTSSYFNVTSVGGSTTIGSGGSGGGSSDSGSTGEAIVTTACTSTDVGIAFQTINATVVSDADAAPSELIDGCVDRANSWSGDYGSIVTLDAGSVHQIQGIYIWSTFARMEWIKIESSADGLSWNTDWTMAPTKPITGPVYYGLNESGSTRYIRLTGFGSDLNTWTNIAEVRWSLSGYNVAGERVYINRQDDIFTVGTLSLENPALAVIEAVARSASIEASGCGAFPIQVWDVTGEMDKFFTVVKHSGSENYLIDFDYRGEDDSDTYSPPSYFWAMTTQYDEDHANAFYKHQIATVPSNLYTCRHRDLDSGYFPAAVWREYLNGHRVPNTAQPDGFR